MDKTEKVKFKMMGSYAGHSFKNNGSIDLKLKFPYSELANTVQLLQCFSQNIDLKAKIGLNKPFSLGLFNIGRINYDSSGEAAITFNSETDYVNVEQISNLVTKELIFLQCTSSIIIEGGEEE